MKVSINDLMKWMPELRDDPIRGHDILAVISICLKQHHDAVAHARPGIDNVRALESARDNFVNKLLCANVNIMESTLAGLRKSHSEENGTMAQVMFGRKVLELYNLIFDIKPSCRKRLMDNDDQLREEYLPILRPYARCCKICAELLGRLLHGYLQDFDDIYKDEEAYNLETFLNDYGDIFQRWTENDNIRLMYLSFLRDKAFGDSASFVSDGALPYLEVTWNVLARRACTLKYHATRVRLQNYVEDARFAVQDKGFKAKAVALSLAYQGLMEEERIDREIVPMMELLLKNRAGDCYSRDSRSGNTRGNGCHVAIEVIRPAIGAALSDIEDAVKDME